jgi:phosphatidylglycerol:prolipoprotein diacylglycerol transferase
VLFALYLVFAGAERFLIEFIRRNDEVAFGLTAAQLESLSLFVVGAVWLLLVGRRGGLLRDDVPDRPRAAVPATS